MVISSHLAHFCQLKKMMNLNLNLNNISKCGLFPLTVCKAKHFRVYANEWSALCKVCCNFCSRSSAMMTTPKILIG